MMGKFINCNSRSILFILAAMLFSIYGCKKRELIPYLELSQSSVESQPAVGNLSLSFKCNTVWEVSDLPEEWLSISPKKGEGDGVVNIAFKTNSTGFKRSATLTMSAGSEQKIKRSIEIGQTSYNLQIKQSSLEFEKGASSKKVEIVSDGDWSISIPENAKWIKANPISGNGNATIEISVDDNKDPERGAIVKVNFYDSFKEVAILQARGENRAPSPPVAISPVDKDKNVSRLIKFLWSSSSDEDGDQVSYLFEISDNEQFSESGGGYFESISLEQTTSLELQTALKGSCLYFWRVKAFDDLGGESSSAIFTFVTESGGVYSDGSCDVILNNSKGKHPNSIIFIGDGYTGRECAIGGKYERDVKAGMDAFFAIEPYRSYREYFKVYRAVAYSKESGVSQEDKGINKDTRFGALYKGGSLLYCNDGKIFDFVRSALGGVSMSKLNDVLIVMILNQDRYAGTCWMYGDGRAIAICPVLTSTRPGGTYANIINHEAGGHGFGRLADEYIHSDKSNVSLPDKGGDYNKENFLLWVRYGYYPNVDVTDDKNAVKWRHFFGVSGYEGVALYEGGYYFGKGVWRPELASCMKDSRPYFNAPSREYIVKLLLRRSAGVRVIDYENGRIVPIPGDPFNFNDFVAKDVQKSERSATLSSYRVSPDYVPLAPPVLRMERLDR